MRPSLVFIVIHITLYISVIILTWQDIVVSILVSVIWKSCRHTAKLFLPSQRQLLELPAESIIVLAVEVGHVVEEDVGRYGHLLFAALHVPVWEGYFAWKVKLLSCLLERKGEVLPASEDLSSR